MAVTQTRTDYHAIDAVSFQVANGEGTDAYSAYCTGQLSVETQIRTIVKTCRGVTTHSKSKPTGQTLTVNAYVPIELVRAWFGLHNEGLKEGVYAYGTDSVGSEFTLVTKISDEFEGKSTMKAFPRIAPTSGYKITVDNDADEVAKLEFEASVQPDDKGNFMYDADSVTDEDVTTWLTAWTNTLVDAPIIP